MPLEQKQSKIVVKTSSGLAHILPETAIEAVDGLSTALSNAVHKTGAETIDGVKTFTKNTMAECVALSSGTVDVTLGSFFTKTITADTTFTFTGAVPGKSCVFSLILSNGGSHVCTFPESVTWLGGQAPILRTSGVDVLTFFTINGGSSWIEVSSSGAGSGSGSIADTGVVAGTYGPAANAAPAYGDSFVIPQITVNSKGQITQVLEKTITIPASDNTDIQVQVISNAWNKAYLLGVDAVNSISGAPLNVTSIADPDVYLTTSPGELHATTFTGSLNGTASRATADSSGANISQTYAKLASPALTGTPTAPTAASGTNTTQIATTAFVQDAFASIATYTGATSSASGTAGLVPAATSAEKDYCLKGDGTWGEVASTSAKEIASIDVEPTASNTADLDNGSLIFWNTGSAQNAPQPVYTSGNQTISGVKTFTAGIFGGTVAMSGNAIDCAAGTSFTKTITANTTFSFTNVPSDATCCVTLILRNGGNYTVTWPSSVKWTGNLPPELTTNGTDVLTFLTCTGGNVWYSTTTCIGVTA